MPTIERRVTELERTRECDAPLLLMFLHGGEPDPQQRAVTQAAVRAGRQVIQVRFVEPEKATREQSP